MQPPSRRELIFVISVFFSIVGSSLAQAPPFLRPPPAPEITRPFPALPPAAALRLDMPSVAEVQRVIPKLEIWHVISALPQKPKRNVQRNTCAAQAYIEGINPVTVRLRFDPTAQGKSVALSMGEGVTFQPLGTNLQISPTGECVVTLVLHEDVSHSVVNFSCEGIMTVLTLKRATGGYVRLQELAAAP